MSSIIIVGAGEFGLTAGLELRRRGWAVLLLEAGRIPHPDAASTDISKVVRMDYGSDPLYTEMGEKALEGWHAWNEGWKQQLYHEDGFLVMSRDELSPGGFEHDSYHLLTARGHLLQRKSSHGLRRDHPAWNAELYPDGYLNPRGGWAESGRVMARLAMQARDAGITIVEEDGMRELVERDGQVVGVLTASGAVHEADAVLVAAGAWTPALLPWLREVMWATGQTVMHFAPADPDSYRPPQFPVWGADIARTGWYGFPANADGIVKVANHGPGIRVDASQPRLVPAGMEERFRGFLRETFPSLANAPLLGSRLCLYCDTFDGHFWIDHDVSHPGLIVAAGDSGHAFKFAPVLGPLIADVVEQVPNAWARRFGWRSPGQASREGARASTDLQK